MRMPHRARGLVDLGVQSSRPLQIARSSCGDWTDTPADEAQTQHRQRKSTRPPRLNHRNAMAAQNMANGTCVPDKNDLRKKMDPPRNRGPEKFSSVAYGGSCVCTHEVTYYSARVSASARSRRTLNQNPALPSPSVMRSATKNAINRGVRLTRERGRDICNPFIGGLVGTSLSVNLG